MASTAPSSPSSSYSNSPSPTSTSRTSPPPTCRSIHSESESETSKDHLTTLPPELLLAIISHLPSSKSLLPLSQTNIYLQTFLLNTHASTVCNNFITTRHSNAAAILSATYRDGWYLPNHEAVISTERKMMREQIRKAGCACVDCQAFLQSSHSTSASSSDISLASNSSTQGCLKLLCLPTSPFRPAQEKITCKAKHVLDSPWNLSLPGPMFLVFLERYDWEIQTRHIMLETECVDADDAMRQEEEGRFNFLVGNYSVRRFLEDVEREFESEPVSEQQPGGEAGHKLGIARRLGGCVKRGWARSRKMLQLRKTPKGADHVMKYLDSTPPLFGEIQPQSDAFMLSSNHDKSSMTGLLWYYGLQDPPPQPDNRTAPNGAPDPDAQQQRQSEPRDIGYHEKSNVGRKDLNHTTGVKPGMDHVCSRMKQVFRRCKQFGAFQSLDG